jgi:hypothetical protein
VSSFYDAFLEFGPIRFVLMVAAAALGWLVAGGIRAWWRRPCHFWSHNKKYIKIEHFTNYNCSQSHAIHTEDEPLWAAVGIWICQNQNCNAHGKKCFGSEAWWTIYNGQMIVDEKKMTDPGEYNTPKAHMDRVRAEKNKTHPATVDQLISRQMREMQKEILHDMEGMFHSFKSEVSIPAEKRKEEGEKK